MVNDIISKDVEKLINFGIKLLDEENFSSNLIKLYNDIFDNEALIRRAGYAIFKNNYENEDLIFIEEKLDLLINFLRKKQIDFEHLEPLFQKVLYDYLNSDCYATANCRAMVVIKLIFFISKETLERFISNFINSTNSQLTLEDDIIKEINIKYPDLINNMVLQELINLLGNENIQNDEFDLYDEIKKFFFMLVENEENIDIIVDKIINEIDNKGFIKANIEKIESYVRAPRLKTFITRLKLKLGLND